MDIGYKLLLLDELTFFHGENERIITRKGWNNHGTTIRCETPRYCARVAGCFKLNKVLTETADNCGARVALPVPVGIIIQETSARQKASQKVLDESVS